jgi:hypothetical protein
MIVRRIAPGSAAKVGGVLYALLGLLIGALFSLFAMVGGGMAGSDMMPMMGMFGAGAIIILPIVYGCLGFIFMFIGAVLYNLVAGWVGGISVDLE